MVKWFHLVFETWDTCKHLFFLKLEDAINISVSTLRRQLKSVRLFRLRVQSHSLDVAAFSVGAAELARDATWKQIPTSQKGSKLRWKPQMLQVLDPRRAHLRQQNHLWPFLVIMRSWSRNYEKMCLCLLSECKASVQCKCVALVLKSFTFVWAATSDASQVLLYKTSRESLRIANNKIAQESKAFSDG